MDLKVFNITPLRKYYFAVFSLVFILVVCSFFLPSVFDFTIFDRYTRGINGLIMIGLLFAASTYLNNTTKKELNNIVQEKEFEEKAALYSSFYKKRLWLNFISLCITFAFVLTSKGKYIFYFFLFQSFMFLLAQPFKKLIAKELQEEEIDFF